ncbi:hypothetical protein DFH05DRAFT_1463624 [Lentinula detonsa]|uniref:CBM21 domain-containing protein n=1 Tax=Lentinula detonsa TaxID=2804962 RepID=A0A9W8NS32_9AGAR|nr:hypothetical protein DFH05DRAFT_1463624 [Lentinula detonsa]
MPYSQPALSPRSPSPSRHHYPRSPSSHSYQNQNHNHSTQSLGRPGHRRSYSSQAQYGFESNSPASIPGSIAKSFSTGTDSARFSNEQSINGIIGTRGAWGGLGSLPRRHSSATTPTISTTSKFRIGDRRESSSSDDDDENDEIDRGLPPLKLKVQVLPSFSGGVPFPKSSADSPVQTGPMYIPNPANVSITRSSAPTRTSSSPDIGTHEPTRAPSAVGTRTASSVILLSNGQPLRSSLKGSRVSSLLNSPMASAANSPSVSPVYSVRNSPVNSTVNSTATSPIMSPEIPGTSAPSFASFANLVPPSFGGHVRAQSAPSPPMTPGQGIEAALESTWTVPISPMSEVPLSPGLSEPPMSPDALLSPRSVHFPSLPTDLERIRVFRKEARPSSLLVTRKERDQLTSSLSHASNNLSTNGVESAEGSGTDVKSGGEETETETETDREYGYGYNAGTWGGRGLWDAAASSKSNRVSSAKVLSPNSKDQSSAFPFPRLPRLGRTSSVGSKGDDDDESSSSSSGSGGLIRIRNTGTGPRFARREEEKEQVGYSRARKVKIELDVPSPVCPVPRPESVRDALSGSTNIFLEDIRLESSSSSASSPDGTESFALEGAFLVRNIAFEKHVCVRFTTDEWSTVNEVRGNWVGSCGKSRLISLASKSGSGLGIPRTFGDLIAFPNYTADENSSEWDRFAFRINLPPAVGLGRTVEFVGRFAVGNAGGEWWDNCGGKNWKVGFKEVEITEPSISAPTLLKKSPSPEPVPTATAKSDIPALSPITPDIPVSTFNDAVDARPVSLPANATPSPTSSTDSRIAAPVEFGVSKDQPGTSFALAASSTTSLSPLDETTVKVQDFGEEQKTFGSYETVTEVKERAPKPTGLGSFSGLGGLFWPWRNVTNLDSTKPTFASSISSSFVEPLDSLPPLGPALEASSDNAHSPSSQVSRTLPASATVEVLSVIPPAVSAEQRFSRISPTYRDGPSTFATPSKVPSQRERIPSGTSVSSVSSTDSVDSMMGVPMLERSSSLSSVSSDGEFGELVDLLRGDSRPATSPKLDLGDTDSTLDLTPVPKGMSVAWSSNDDSVGEDQTGFFDNTGPAAGSVGIASPSAGVEKPHETDPLYRAFVQQWCFAGTSTGSPVASESSTHTPNRNRLQVM